MKYVTYNFTFKNGIKQVYTLKIEPHELEGYKLGVKEVNSIIQDSMRKGANGEVHFDSTQGRVYINTYELISVVVVGIDEL